MCFLLNMGIFQPAMLVYQGVPVDFPHDLKNLNFQANAVDPHGATALLRAVQLGITARPCIEALLKSSADVTRASDSWLLFLVIRLMAEILHQLIW